MLPHSEMRRELLSWSEIDRLIDHLLPQFHGEFDGLLMITRGGLIPGGLLTEALGIEYVLTASVHFPDDVAQYRLAWPTFMQFPSDSLLAGRRILIVDDIWAAGRTIVTARSRVQAAHAYAETAVLHYRPRSNLFASLGPDYYGAITDAYIVYPWETAHPPRHLRRFPPPN